MALEGLIEKEDPPHCNGRRKLDRRKLVNAQMGTPASFAETEKLISGRDAGIQDTTPSTWQHLINASKFRVGGGEFPCAMLLPDILLDVPGTGKIDDCAELGRENR